MQSRNELEKSIKTRILVGIRTRVYNHFPSLSLSFVCNRFSVHSVYLLRSFLLMIERRYETIISDVLLPIDQHSAPQAFVEVYDWNPGLVDGFIGRVEVDTKSLRRRFPGNPKWYNALFSSLLVFVLFFLKTSF